MRSGAAAKPELRSADVAEQIVYKIFEDMIHKKEIYVNAKQGVIFHKNVTHSLPCKRYSNEKNCFNQNLRTT